MIRKTKSFGAVKSDCCQESRSHARQNPSSMTQRVTPSIVRHSMIMTRMSLGEIDPDRSVSPGMQCFAVEVTVSSLRD